MSRELIPDPSMSVAMATVSIVGVGDGWSSPCPGHRSSREGARNDDPRVVVANSSLNALGEVPGGSGNRPEVFIGQGQPFVGFNTPGNDKNGIVGRTFRQGADRIGPHRGCCRNAAASPP